MIYKFWIDADYFDNIDAVILDDSNIADIQYKSFRKGWFKLAFESGNDIDLSLLPDIKFYYDSLKGNIFSEVLINAFGVVIVLKKLLLRREFWEFNIYQSQLKIDLEAGFVTIIT